MTSAPAIPYEFAREGWRRCLEPHRGGQIPGYSIPLFDLSGSAKKHSFETEGAYVAAPWLKIYGDAKDVVLGVESAGN